MRTVFQPHKLDRSWTVAIGVNLSLAKMLSGANAFRISGYKLKPEDRMQQCYMPCAAAGEITIRQPGYRSFLHRCRGHNKGTFLSMIAFFSLCIPVF